MYDPRWQPPPPPPPPPPGYGYGYPPPPKTNGLAIASMVVSLVGGVSLVLSCCLVAILGIFGLVLPPVIGLVAGLAGAIMGHVGRRQCRQRGDRGAGMALTGVIVGWITVALTVIVLLLAALAVIGLVAWFSGAETELPDPEFVFDLLPPLPPILDLSPFAEIN